MAVSKDPTDKYRRELSVILNELKAEGAIDYALKEKLFPTECNVPKMYGLPKVHKVAVPLRPIGWVQICCKRYNI